MIDFVETYPRLHKDVPVVFPGALYSLLNHMYCVNKSETDYYGQITRALPDADAIKGYCIVALFTLIVGKQQFMLYCDDLETVKFIQRCCLGASPGRANVTEVVFVLVPVKEWQDIQLRQKTTRTFPACFLLSR
ncbi:hypothetical protein A2533_00750 [Candidatus Falkowbacteria bacterium RIFOXYD2_FULL_35_9]|uniref:Uncharacterized protein n=1 Tax=Candidatus Falkowbacteria bacterium RIFOXYC2_FULL_36_12 TaxID=1798002 RepID=A0A1F5T370_9BACT|nr:MAG: hypothetical protein A2300_04370 [Candidatus Falkowbacteria bacterium RIFOXYB2_FULL_35_7]OGF33079.1 MAG: hypothetical protein A2223_05075 [Candidatus Falkowbacteria bacterium RIFOXYA2_FULL_35_8]OGF33359.1 MAG: hypothetical protein A2478_01505 [Candidatus Falkowbacteria bacterium RIFOXYC2_FULL_36_12]OGF45604.1 MAG: hypothetical protein A2533_00750 [Candidatus Falkowbacteria bacterium RIFOXYD2_FULL_35_9]